MARLRLTVLLAAAFLLGGLLGWRGARVGADPAPSPPADESFKYMLLFSRVLQLVRQDYFDPGKVQYKDLTYAALRGMLASLDHHSQFLDEEAFADLQRETQGGPFSGLGIIVGVKEDGSTVIVSPMEDSPAGRAGLLPGDRILRINGVTTEHLTIGAVGDMLKGAVGEPATLTILRPSAPGAADGEVFEKTLTREIIELHSVKDPHLLPASVAGKNKVGYLRIEEFGQNTPEEFNHALDGLEKQGLQALVIDLRNNPGGLVNAAVEVAGEFMPPNTVIVSLKGRSADQDEAFRASEGRERPDYPIAVLVNGYSASAAEIVAGAFKDLKRGVIVGETTFGKGSVQTVQSLGNGIGLRLTTAKYFTPGGESIHEIGVAPDVSVPITNLEERRIILAEAKRALTPEEKTEAAKADDRQLTRAVSALRTVCAFRAKQQAMDGGTAAPAWAAPSDPAH
jgi:carboxyl-terminal processing protease